MADNNNTSTTQHITRLDFDITKAEQQLEELEKKLDAISKEIAGKNWTINAVINGDEELDKLGQAFEETSIKLKDVREESQKAKESIDDMAKSGTDSTSRLVSAIETRLVSAFKNASKAAV